MTFADPGEYAGRFSDNEGVNAELVIRYQISHPCVKSALAEHLAPNGSIGKNHCSSTRVLRTFSIFGAVPASARSLRPASLAISDFKASRINSALSVTPVYSCAVLKRSSSSTTVALI